MAKKPIPAGRTALMAAAALAAAFLPRQASAQTVLIDQGVFRLSLSGREIGRDSFDIRRMGSGDNTRVQAQGWTEIEGRRVHSLLETTASHAVTGYQATVTAGSASTRLRAQVTGRRMELTVISPAGEQTREARAPAGAVMLDGYGAHPYYFVAALAREGSTLPVMVPSFEDGESLVVESIAAATLSVGGTELEARRIQLAAGAAVHRVWVDAQGRLLRVETPTFLAERVRPPA